jgi:hypothetical protein
MSVNLGKTSADRWYCQLISATMPQRNTQPAA